MTEAAIYARVSTDHQEQNRTIESQIAELRSVAERDRVKIVEEYLDDGVSGASLERPALDRLRDDAARGRFSRLYVHSADRLARKYVYQAIVLEELARHGVEIIFRDRPVGDGPEDQLLLGIEGLIAEYERAKITERTRRGRLHRARQGEIVSGHAPFGYRYLRRQGQRARFRVHPEHAAAVRLIFDLYLKLGSSTAVARELHTRCVPSATGAAWSATRVGRVLRNESYAGISYFNKTQGKGAYRDRSEWVPVKIQPIVSREVFDAVQRLMSGRGGGKKRREYLLSGLVVCAHCGCRYGGNRSDNTNVYYRCTNARHRFPAPRDCFAKQVPAERLELAVTRALVDALEGRDAILRFVRQRATPRHALASRARERARIEREVVELASRQTRLLDAYLEGGLSKARYLQQHQALEQRSSELGERLDEMGRHVNAPSGLDIERSIDHFARLARKRLSHRTPVELRQFLGVLIESVSYDWKERLAVVRARLPVVDLDDEGVDSVSPFPGGKAPDRGDTVAFELKVPV